MPITSPYSNVVVKRLSVELCYMLPSQQCPNTATSLPCSFAAIPTACSHRQKKMRLKTDVT